MRAEEYPIQAVRPFGALVRSLRPAQWVKNLLVFAGLVFAEKLGEPALARRSLQAFLVFCLMASAVYLLNDLLDRERDRNHPLKRHRPIAAGLVDPRLALAVSGLLSATALGWALALGPVFLLTAAGYLVLNLLYTLQLKHLVILDVMAVALGFVLRVLAGTLVIAVATSPWLLACTFLLSLFLGFGKRRHELLLLQSEAAGHRAVLGQYSPYFLDQLIGVVTSSTLVCYTLYTLSPETVAKFGGAGLLYTVPFVSYGIFRYLYLIHRESGGGDPAQLLLTDRPLQGAVLGWLLVVALVLYWP